MPCDNTRRRRKRRRKREKGEGKEEQEEGRKNCNSFTSHWEAVGLFLLCFRASFRNSPCHTIHVFSSQCVSQSVWALFTSQSTHSVAFFTLTSGFGWTRWVWLESQITESEVKHQKQVCGVVVCLLLFTVGDGGLWGAAESLHLLLNAWRLFWIETSCTQFYFIYFWNSQLLFCLFKYSLNFDANLFKRCIFLSLQSAFGCIDRFIGSSFISPALKCVGSLWRVTSFSKRQQQAGVALIFTTRERRFSGWLPSSSSRHSDCHQL